MNCPPPPSQPFTHGSLTPTFEVADRHQSLHCTSRETEAQRGGSDLSRSSSKITVLLGLSFLLDISFCAWQPGVPVGCG